MGSFKSLFVLLAGAAIGGAALIAYRISQETGKPFQEALSDVPGEAQRMFADLKGRATEAVERGREMYVDKQEEVEELLREDTSSE
jgi:gas vesicle protein